MSATQHFVAERLELTPHRAAHRRFIFDDENGVRDDRRRDRQRRRGRGDRFVLRQRQVNDHRGAAADLGRDRHHAA